MPTTTPPATCAICLQPLVRRQDVRIAASEVVHVACARAGGKTIGWRQREELAQLQVRLESQRAQLERLQREQGTRAALHAEELEQLARQHRTAEAQLMTQLARARVELEAARFPAPAPVTPAAHVAAAHTEDSERSAIEQRFSLLELD